jgi:hypothetical protein
MKKLTAYITFISFAILFIFSCQKDKTSDLPVDNNGSNNSLRTTVSGIVLDESNAPLNGVTVTAYGQTASTDQHGVFVLKNINANRDRCVLKFFKTGFFKRSHGFIASGNTVNYVRIILVSNAATQNFSSSAGGTISLLDGSSAVFQPNSFVTSNGSAYMGTVNLIVKHLSPDDVNFGFMIPGGDLLGKDVNDKDVALYTYGMLGVELTGSSGEALQLANGKTATLTLAIAASQLSSAPASIPLWYFDETTSLWKEEGSANKVGNNYVGSVGHFSWWNCDYPGGMASIKGTVIDCQNIPLPNILVTLLASNGYSISISTNQNGDYQILIATGFSSTLQVLTSNNPWLSQNSQIENVPALTVNQIYTVPDFVVFCPTRVAGAMQTCDGQNISAYVIISNNDFFTYQFSTDNSFNLPVVPNSQLVLNAFYNNLHYHQIITSLSAPSVLNVGTVKLCDTISVLANSFTINGGPFSNQEFYISSTTATGTVNYTTHQTDIHVAGNSSPYTINWFDIAWLGDTVGSYSFPLLDIDMVGPTGWYEISNSGMGNFTITQIDSIGGRIKGYFTTVCSMEGDSGMYQGTASGFFDVTRTQ